jgi:hypothetical protein
MHPLSIVLGAAGLFIIICIIAAGVMFLAGSVAGYVCLLGLVALAGGITSLATHKHKPAAAPLCPGVIATRWRA